jgi:hypothetical protein
VRVVVGIGNNRFFFFDKLFESVGGNVVVVVLMMVGARFIVVVVVIVRRDSFACCSRCRLRWARSTACRCGFRRHNWPRAKVARHCDTQEKSDFPGAALVFSVFFTLHCVWNLIVLIIGGGGGGGSDHWHDLFNDTHACQKKKKS